jgi:Fur family zinc uptake transcriptional regulator
MGAMPRAPSSPRASAKAQATATQATDIDAQLASADRHCLDHGLKLTSGRKAVLQALLRRGGTAKAYELLADLQSGGASVAPMAVYRSITTATTNPLF